MRRSLALVLLLLLNLPLARGAEGKRSALDLVGNWEGTMKGGRFELRLLIRITKSKDGKLQTTVDLPDEGAKGMPVAALLYNHPAVRMEIDQFGTSFNGKLSEDGNEIAGVFDEGPDRKPAAVVLKRSTEPDKPEPIKSYTFAEGEPWDIRGYWKGAVEAREGAKQTVGLRIGRLPDGTFKALMDAFDQGDKDVPASAVTFTNPVARLEWHAFRGVVFEGKLSDDGKKLGGEWEQFGRKTEVSFERLDKALTPLPEDLSFVPDKDSPGDLRGYWKGALEVPDGPKLRLAMKIGKAPDGSLAGTLASLDQGGGELPATSIGYTNPAVRMEWKLIRGVFEGTVNQDGTLIDGSWKQMGKPLPLKMERTAPPREEKP